jgi:hypothetical protein
MAAAHVFAGPLKNVCGSRRRFVVVPCGRWTFGSSLYAAGSYKGLANLKWTCSSPCVSRNYLIQVLPPVLPMQPPLRRC